jgi:hypothetical protein
MLLRIMPLPLPDYLAFHQFYRMLIRKAGNVEPIAHDLDHCSRVFVYQIGHV